MTDWRGRLEAVVTLGLPPEPKDGEVQCINPTCGNAKLNRKDMTCWRCGGDRFAPASDEMRHALRFNYVPPPAMVASRRGESDIGPGVGIPLPGYAMPSTGPVPIPGTTAYELAGTLVDDEGCPHWITVGCRDKRMFQNSADEISRRWRHYQQKLRERA